MRSSITALATVVPWNDCDEPDPDDFLIKEAAQKLGVSPEFVAARTHEVVIGVRQRTGERISVEAALESVVTAGLRIQDRAMALAKKAANDARQRPKKGKRR